MDSNTINQLIRNRRAIYPALFKTGQEIPKEHLREILENANWAPTHRHTEPWRFQVFTGDARQALSDYLGKYYRENTPKERQSEMKYKKTVSKPLQSSAVLAICMKRDPMESVPEWEEIAAVAMAVQNIWLSIEAYGLAGYWSSPKALIEADAFLGLQDNERCLGVFYLGYFDGEKPEGRRSPMAEKVIWRE